MSSGYQLKGQEVEACDCASICPCVFGEEPEHGSCFGILARHVEKGKIGDVDVSGVTWLEVFQSPGHQLDGGTTKLVYIDRKAKGKDLTAEQVGALRSALDGGLGGPLGELAKLTRAWLGFEQVDVKYEADKGKGSIAVAGKLRVVMTPRTGRDDKTSTTLKDAFFSTVPGAPAWVAKGDELTVAIPEHGIFFAFEGRSAIQSEFDFKTQ